MTYVPPYIYIYILLASERSERDTLRVNAIEISLYLLASERSERDTLRGNAIEISLYLFIWYVGPLFPPGLLIVKREELRVSRF